MIQRDLQVAAVIGDLYAGRPVGYTTFLAYDEVAHHSGVERVDALAVLRGSTANSRESRPRRRMRTGRTTLLCSPTTASPRGRRSSTATASR